MPALTNSMVIQFYDSAPKINLNEMTAVKIKQKSDTTPQDQLFMIRNSVLGLKRSHHFKGPKNAVFG